MTDLTVEDYSERSIVVRGDTKTYASELKQMGGKWNSRLKGGGGWIFPKKREDDVLAFVSTSRIPTDESKITHDKGDIFVRLENMFSTMDFEQRLRFVSRVSVLALNKDMIKPKESKVTRSKPKKADSESDIEIESDSDSEEEAPIRRLLR